MLILFGLALILANTAIIVAGIKEDSMSKMFTGAVGFIAVSLVLMRLVMLPR